MTNVFQQPYYGGHQALQDAIARNDLETLPAMIVAAALYEEDFNLVYDACVQLSEHSDEIVRGNAVLGLGHLARLFGRLGDEAPSILRRSLGDPSAYVRGQAYAAASDVRHFLNIRVTDETDVKELPDD